MVVLYASYGDVNSVDVIFQAIAEGKAEPNRMA
jgi:hypothetical protein